MVFGRSVLPAPLCLPSSCRMYLKKYVIFRCVVFFCFPFCSFLSFPFFFLFFLFFSFFFSFFSILFVFFLFFSFLSTPSCLFFSPPGRQPKIYVVTVIDSEESVDTESFQLGLVLAVVIFLNTLLDFTQRQNAIKVGRIGSHDRLRKNITLHEK